MTSAIRAQAAPPLLLKGAVSPECLAGRGRVFVGCMAGGHPAHLRQLSGQWLGRLLLLACAREAPIQAAPSVHRLLGAC